MKDFPYRVVGLWMLGGASFALVFSLGFALLIGGMWYFGLPLLGALVGGAFGVVNHYFDD